MEYPSETVSIRARHPNFTAKEVNTRATERMREIRLNTADTYRN